MIQVKKSGGQFCSCTNRKDPYTEIPKWNDLLQRDAQVRRVIKLKGISIHQRCKTKVSTIADLSKKILAMPG